MISLLFLAGGTGARMGTDIPKQYLFLKGKPLALHSFDILSSLPFITEVIVVCSSDYHHLFSRTQYASPGKRRQDSVFNALQLATSPFILIHDAARPFVDIHSIDALVEMATKYGAATLGVPVKSTIKKGTIGGKVQETLPRDHLIEIQTPQLIKREWLIEGYANIGQETVTDDVSLIEKLGYPVYLVMGSYQNIKVTTPEDLKIAEVLF